MMTLLSIKQFFNDMRHQKLRTLLTMFGILWGTVSIVLLMSFGTGLHKSQIKRFKGLGENISIVWGGRTSQPWQGLPRGRRVRFTEEDVSMLKQTVPSIQRISPEFTRYSAPLKSHRENLVARVSGVWPEFSEMRNTIPQTGGRFINDIDIEKRRRVIFIGNILADRLFPGEDPIGQILQLDGTPFVVVGVMKDKEQNSSYGGRDTRNAFIPASTYHSTYTQRYVNNMVVQSYSMDGMEDVKNAIYRYMAAKYKFDPDDTEALSIWDTSEGFRFFNTFFMAFRIFLVGIGCFTLITGGIGVTNIMNVVLEERTKEIGIKMALGAKRYVILMQFMMETALLTATGGLIGFIIAYGIVKIFPVFGLSEELGNPIIDFYATIGAVMALGLIAFLAGLFPARRASSIEPVKALKLF